MSSLTDQLDRERKAERQARAENKRKIAAVDVRHLEGENVKREIATLRNRLEAIEPAEAEAKAIRKRLNELEN